MALGCLNIVALILFAGSAAGFVELRSAVHQPLTVRWGSWGLPSIPEAAPRGLTCLGVDYGLKRVGTATMSGWAARRLLTLQHPGDDLAVAKRLVGLAVGEGCATVVVGLPLDKDGTETTQVTGAAWLWRRG